MSLMGAGPPPDDDLAPSDAFAVLGNETRMAILRSLWELEAVDPDTSVSFSRLLEAVGHGDPGNFNYHLKKLVDHFVRHGDDGYHLSPAGEGLLRSIFSGAFTRTPMLEPTEVDAQCPFCASPVEVWYEDEQFGARCTACEGVMVAEDRPQGIYMEFDTPPALIEGRDADEALAAAHAFYDSKITAMMNGVCPECAGTVDVSFDPCTDHEQNDRGICDVCRSREAVWIDARCTNCRYRRRFLPSFAVVTLSVVVRFFEERDAPWDRIPFPKLTAENAPYLQDIGAELLPGEPRLVAVTVRWEGDELVVVLDESLDVVEVREDE
jgi:DNA-binding transcriptional ArsR family regulator